MKKLSKYLIIPLIGILIASCATQNQDSGGFYGYDNTPEREVFEKPQKPKTEWSNPLANNSQPDQATNSADNQNQQVVVNNYYNNNGFVPVIAPWYGGYYGWGSRSNRSRTFVSYGNFRSYEWYSPWYDYHPYYGCTWYDYYYVRPHYRTWYNQPVYSYSPYYNRSWRQYGNDRGRHGYSGYSSNPRSNYNNRDVSYNPRSTRIINRRSNANYGSTRSTEGSYTRSRSTGATRSTGSSYSSPTTGSSNSNGSYSSPSNSNSRSSSSGSSSSKRGGSSGSYERSGSSSKSSGSSRSGGNNRSSGSSRSSSNKRGGG